MATYGVQYFMGIPLGYQEGATPSIRFPATIDYAAVTASQIKAYTVNGGTLFLAPFASDTTKSALITISLANASGRQWRLLPFGSGYVTQARMDDGKSWALVIVAVTDASAANFRTIQADSPITVVETGVAGYRALLTTDYANLSGTAKVVNFFGGQVALNSVAGTSVFALLTAGGVSAPDAPTLSAPAAAATLDDDTPDFSWVAVAGATSYDIEIRTTLTGTPTATGIAGTTYTPSALTYAAQYSWRVRGVNAAGAGAWSATRTFKLSYRLKVLSFSPTEFWMLAETSGTNAAAQLDANKNGTYGGSLTLNGLTFTDGSPAPVFDGTNDQVELLTAALQSAWSQTQGALSIWLYDTDGVAGTLRVMTSFGDTDAAQYTKVYKSTTHRADILKATNREAAAARVTATWRHVFISWNNTGNIARMVFDGVDTAPNVTTLSGSGDLNHAWVGRRVDGRFWIGGLCRIAYWNTVQAVATGQALAVID